MANIPDMGPGHFKVEDDYNYDANNMEVFKKINALLENTLDMSSLANNSPIVGHEQVKVKNERSLEQLFGNMHVEPAPTNLQTPQYLHPQQYVQPAADPYYAALANYTVATPATSPSIHPMTYNPQDFSAAPRSHVDPYAATYTYARNHDYGTHNMATHNMATHNMATHNMATPKTVYGARHPNDFSQASQNYHAQAQQADFIQGAISNRTLEQITESFARPYRAIKAAEFTGEGVLPPTMKAPGTLQSAMKTPESKAKEEGLSKLFGSRSGSPTDSDTSGIGSECSDATLLDLMTSLSLTQQPSGATSTQSKSLMTSSAQQQVELLRALGLPQETLSLLRESQQAGVDLADVTAGQLTAINPLFSTTTSDPYSIERAAKLYRSAASICEATCTWSGQLPPKIYKSPTYSCKVFLGGVPWDITEAGLQGAFKMFGPMKIEWPGRDGKHPRYPPKAGYVYVLFECEKSVRALLQACTQDFSNGGEFFYRISSRRMRSKEVQVIPWVLSDSNYVRQSSQRLDPTKTVFVGALHGMLTAEALACIVNDLFGNVVYAGIDTDKHKYPIGSGRVTFSSHKSYMKAVNAAFVEVKTPKFTKKIQVDPYLEDSLCNICSQQQGPFFCRDLACFRYFCRTCWQWTHAFDSARHHKPLMRNNRGTNTPTTIV